jgi:protein-S-isoprenylcysteine O-methyltransferase Ste14
MAHSKALPPTYLIITMVVMLGLHFSVPVTTLITYPSNLLGSIPLVTGVALNLMADRALKIYKTTVKPFQVSSALVTTGVYRISRHPMYLGMVLILIGGALLMGSLSPFLAVVMFAALMELIFVRAEERMLEQEFGERWRAYKQRVRRWI